MEDKKYGLIRLSKVNKSINTLKPSIFGTDSDSDEECSEHKTMASSSGVIRRQTQMDISRALTVDPNVFEYDSIYDEMKTKKESFNDNNSEKIEKKPKYINSLLKYSENRKKEQERRVERKIQKERESEGNMFADKEAFVTNAYKEKLEEIRIAEENDLREQAIDELLDVKKQKDLSGFYRNLLNNKISNDSTDAETDKSQTENQVSKISSKPKPIRQIRRRRSSSEESSKSSSHEQKDNTETVSNISQKMYNKEESDKSKNERHNESDGENDASSVEDLITNKSNANVEKKEIKSKQSIDSLVEIDSNKNEEKAETNNKVSKLDKREILLKKIRKRTIGEVYESAKLRYFERKDKYIIS